MKPFSRRRYLKQIGLVVAASALSEFLGARLLAAAEKEGQPQPTPAERAAMAGIAHKFLDQYW